MSVRGTRSIRAISVNYSESVSVALSIQHAKLMHRVILSNLATLCLNRQYLKGGGEITEHKTRV
jgi:hypothetical protein